MAAGYEGSLLKSYIWSFEATDGSSMIGLAIPDLKNPTIGTYSGRADIFATIKGQTMDGSAVPCTVTIQ